MPPGPFFQFEEHDGYICVGCERTWATLERLHQHRRCPAMRNTACELEEISKELRNIYREIFMLQDISSEGQFFKRVHTYYVTTYN